MAKNLCNGLPESVSIQQKTRSFLKEFFFKKWANPGLFFMFGLFKQTIQFLQQINVKNIHPIYGAGIRTHDLSNMSRVP